MASFNISKGLEASLPSTKTDGKMYFCTDTGNIYIDYKDGNNILRKLVNKQILDAKQNAITGAASTITSSNLTANRVLLSNSSGKIAASAITDMELSYLDGVTSNIQTQLDGKLSKTGGELTGNITLKADASGSPSIVFQRGTSSDAYTDWRIQDNAGRLKFSIRGSGASDFADKIVFREEGNIEATNFVGNLTGNADTATKATQDASGNIITSTYATKTELTNGLAGKANTSHNHTSIKYNSSLSTDEAIDNFLEANTVKTAIWNSTSSPGVGNGIITSFGWASTDFGAQIAIDDDPTGFMSMRQKNTSGWSNWKRIQTSDGSGASGTWGINITGNASTASTASIATKASGLIDPNDSSRIIKIGFQGASLATNDIAYIAGYKTGGNLIKDVRKADLQSWLGLGTGAYASAYSLPTASSSTLGGVKTTSTVTSTSGLTACPIINGVPYYKDTNTTYNLSSFGVTATAAELNYTDGVTSNIQTQLNAKVPTSRTINGKSLSGNISITKSDVGLGNVDNTADSDKNVESAAVLRAHTQLTTAEAMDNFIAGNKLKYTTFKLTEDTQNLGFGSNDGMLLSIPWGSSQYGFQMAFDDTVDGKIAVRGKSTTWGSWYRLIHSGNIGSQSVNYATSTGVLATDSSMKLYSQNNNELNFGGSNNSNTIYFGYRATDSKPIPSKFIFGGSTGTSELVAAKFTGSLAGNAATATKLATVRTISLTGDVTGSVSFDGSKNASITATVADDSHNHVISNIDGLQTALDGKVSNNRGYINKSLTWNGNSYIQHVILLFPVPQSTTWCGHNYIDGKFFLWKTGGNVYDGIEIAANCVYGSLRYCITAFGDHATSLKLCVCKYGGVQYYAIKCPYHANPYLFVTFVGRTYSDLTPSGISLPLDIAYYDENSQAVLNAEVKNSITDTLTTTYVTSATTAGVYSIGGFAGSLSGNATSATKATQDASGNIITSTYATKTELTNGLAGKAASSHTHDDRYYTETEINNKISTLNTAIDSKAPSSHNHTYLTLTGDTVANRRTQASSQALLVGGWANSNAGYGSQYGTSLDVSGYSTWYHRLAFHTGGEIDYWMGINTNTLSKVGRIITSANIGSQSVNYATSAGSASSATALTSKSIGSATNPVYFDANGKPVKTTYTLGKSVPSNAKFTDTTYSNFVKSGSGAKAGLVPAPSTTAGTTKYLREDGTWQVPPDTNTTYTFNGAVSTIKDSNLTASRALISNSSGKVAVSAVTSTELGYLDGVTSNIQTQLNGKAPSSHTHTSIGNITTNLELIGLAARPTYKTSANGTTATMASYNLARMNDLGRTTAVNASDTNYTTYMARGIAAGTTDLTAGSSKLTSGCIYLVYE